MKPLYSFLLVLRICNASAQTTIWAENFGTGCNQNQWANGVSASPGTGTWTVTYNVAPTSGADEFYISSAEAGMGAGNCSNGCIVTPADTNRTLHIGFTPYATTSPCPGGDCGATYNPSIFSNLRAESPVINCTGVYGMTLSFDYLAYGQTGSDYAEVYCYCPMTGPLTFTMWNVVVVLPQTNCGDATCSNTNVPCSGLSKGVWTTYSVNLPPDANNFSGLRIGFGWSNNGDNIGTDPSFAVDNIKLTAAVAMEIQPTGPGGNALYKLYPNPSHDLLNLLMNSARPVFVQLEVADALGRTFMRQTTATLLQNMSHSLDISGLEKGIYFLKISSADPAPVIIKFVKE